MWSDLNFTNRLINVSHLLFCDNIKNEDPSGIGRIGCGGSGTSDIRRGLADTIFVLSSPLSIISFVSSSWSVYWRRRREYNRYKQRNVRMNCL